MGLLIGAGFLLRCPAAPESVPDSRRDYNAIVERNVFGLKPMPPPSTPSNPAPPAPPKITLTGITTILGDKTALLKAELPASKPGEKAKEQPLILSEGQREGNIELLKVNENAGTVTVNDYGTVMTVAFPKVTSGTPASPPASPPQPNGIHRGMRPIPTRTGRWSPVPTPNTPLTQPGHSAASATIQNGAAQPTPTNAPPDELTPEEQAILQQLEREQTQPNPQ